MRGIEEKVTEETITALEERSEIVLGTQSWKVKEDN